MGTPSGVVITGATGLVGTALAASCAGDGVKISALVRNTAQAVVKLPSATLHAWDATKAPPPEGAFEGMDAVVNLVGEPIGVGRWTEDRKKRLRDSRVVGTRALVDALRGLSRRPAVLISASGTGYYGDQGDKNPDRNVGGGPGLPRRAGARLGGRGPQGARARHAGGFAPQRRRAVS